MPSRVRVKTTGLFADELVGPAAVEAVQRAINLANDGGWLLNKNCVLRTWKDIPSVWAGIYNWRRDNAPGARIEVIRERRGCRTKLQLSGTGVRYRALPGRRPRPLPPLSFRRVELRPTINQPVPVQTSPTATANWNFGNGSEFITDATVQQMRQNLQQARQTLQQAQAQQDRWAVPFNPENDIVEFR